MKKFISLGIIIILLVVLLAGCSTEEVPFNEELVVNGDFEEGENSWLRRNGDGAIFDIASIHEESDQFRDQYGEKQLSLHSGMNDNWMYLTQEIQVNPNSVYRLEIEMYISNSITNSTSSSTVIGAFVGFEEDGGLKRINRIEATDGWQKYIVYVRPINDEILNIQVGLGTSTSLAKGTVKFDNVSMVRLEEEPVGVEIYNVGSTASINRSNTQGNLYVILLAIATGAVMLAAYFAIRRLYAINPSIDADNKPTGKGIIDFIKSPVVLMTSVLILAFLVRLIIVNSVYGSYNDISMFTDWASSLVSDKPWNFYDNVDTHYTPGYMYVLWLFGSLAKLLGLSAGSMGMAIFLKIPAIVCDIIIVYLIFYLASKHYNIYISTILASIYAILPVIFTNSAAWGQMDSVYGLFVLLSFIAILDKKYLSVIIYYTLAVFLRAETLILLPLVASFMIYSFIKNPLIRTKMIVASISAFIGIIVLSLPFTVLLGGAKPVFYIFSRFIATATATPVFSSNAFNFYGIFGLNGETVSTFSTVLSWMIYIIIAFYTCFIYFYKKNRAELLLLASFLISAVAVFSTRITPQSIIISFALMLAYIAISGEKRVFLLFGILSLTSFLNIAQLMNQSGFISNSANAQIVSFPDNSPFMIIFGIINVVAILYFALVVYDICYSDDIREFSPMHTSIKKLLFNGKKK